MTRALLIERVKGTLRNHELSRLNGGFELGWLVGPLLGGLAVALRWEVPFGVATVALLLCTFGGFLTIPTINAVRTALVDSGT